MPDHLINNNVRIDVLYLNLNPARNGIASVIKRMRFTGGMVETDLSNKAIDRTYGFVRDGVFEAYSQFAGNSLIYDKDGV